MDLDALISKHYGVQLSGAQLLEEQLEILIDEVITGFTGIIKEEKGPEGTPEIDTDKLLLSMIPEIPVSEIGWSDMSTDEAGKPIPGPQRKLLEDYLNNIGGDSLQDKLINLSEFYTNPESSSSAEKERVKKIQKIMSYLVFFKTLTTVITNFNASSAGFSFESFLAVLLNGKQVPANTGTIADFEAKTPIIPADVGATKDDQAKYLVSLKLYGEDNVEVGGSYQDLIDDIITRGSMRYLVVTKTLVGRGLTQKGTLKFYTFNITLRNIFDILIKSSERSRECIVLPFVKGGEGKEMVSPGEELPPRIKVSNEELTKAIHRRMRENLSDLFNSDPALVQALEQPETAIGKIVDSPYFNLEDVDYPLAKSRTDWQVKPLKSLFENKTIDIFKGVEEGEKYTDQIAKIVGSIRQAQKGAVAELITIPTKARHKQIAAILPSFKGANSLTRSQAAKKAKDGEEATERKEGSVVQRAKDSLAYYNGLLDDESRIQALKTSNGYLNTLHWALGKGLVTGGGLGTARPEEEKPEEESGVRLGDTGGQGPARGTETPDTHASGRSKLEEADEPKGKEVVEKIGELKIGSENVQDILNKAKDLLNDEIFGIFAALKDLSANLNNFIASGLDDQAGSSAIENAESVKTKTEKVKTGN